MDLLLLLSVLLSCSALVDGGFTSPGSSFADDAVKRHNSISILLQGGAQDQSQVVGPYGDGSGCSCPSESTTPDHIEVHDDCCDGSINGSTVNIRYGESDLPLILQYCYREIFEIKYEHCQKSWALLIQKIQEEVIFDHSLSDEEKIVYIHGHISAFTKIHEKRATQINRIYIPEWNGYTINLGQVAVAVRHEQSYQIIGLDEHENCVLFDLMRQNPRSADNETRDAIEHTIGVLRDNIKNETCYSRQHGAPHYVLKYTNNFEIEDKEVPEYGTVSVFDDVATYYTAGEAADRLVYYLVPYALNGSAEVYEDKNTFPASHKYQIRQLVDKLLAEYEKTSGDKGRADIFNKVLYDWLDSQDSTIPFLWDVELEGCCQIWELVHAVAFKSNCNCIGTCPTEKPIVPR